MDELDDALLHILVIEVSNPISGTRGSSTFVIDFDKPPDYLAAHRALDEAFIAFAANTAKRLKELRDET